MINHLINKIMFLVAIKTPEDVENLVSKIHDNKSFGTIATNFPPEKIFATIIFSLFGFAYFIGGKKNADFTYIFTGMALMGFTYLVKEVVYVVLVGTALVLTPHFLKRF